MGIEKFFNSLKLQNSLLKESIVTNIEKKIDCDYLYIDFNSIIYTIANETETSMNYLLYSIIINEISEITKQHAEKLHFNLENATLESYNQYFTKQNFDDLIIEYITKYIKNMTKNMLEPNNLKNIFIAFDGVPQMAKVVEQKRRRYNGFVESKIRKNIFQKHYDNLTKERQLYETNKLSFDRGQIMAHTNFMQNVSEIFMSKEFKFEMKEINKNLEEIIISHQNIFGEGEKKIIEHINETQKKGKYVLFSPDADVIILGMIIHNLLDNNSEFTILRHNQQTKNHDAVNINLLIDTIFEYILLELKNNNIEIELEKKRTINDILLIFTFFGNDFLPRMETIDVRSDIKFILSYYTNCIQLFNNKYIIFEDKSGYKINFDNLAIFIKHLSQDEEQLLYDTYLANKYKNYNFNRKILGSDKLIFALNKYCDFANKIFDDIRIHKDVDKIDNENQDMQLKKSFIILETKRQAGINADDILNNDNPEEISGFFKKLLSNLVENFNKDKLKGNLFFVSFSTDFEDDLQYHTTNIKKNFVHDKIEISDFDKELYTFERKIGQYEKILNAEQLELGSCIFYIDKKGNYAIKTKKENMINEISIYYNEMFNINLKTKKNITLNNMFNTDEANKLAEEYVKGFMWIFDNYFNKNTKTFNINIISTWFYEHHKAPLLTNLSNYLNQQDLSKKLILLWRDTIHGTTIKRDEYFSKIEHNIYVSPMNNLIELPEEYKKIIDEHTEIFIDMQQYANDIIDNINTKKILDCRRIAFFNKCIMKKVPVVQFKTFSDLFKDIKGKEIIKGKEFIINYTKKMNRNIAKYLYLTTKNMRYKNMYKSS